MDEEKEEPLNHEKGIQKEDGDSSMKGEFKMARKNIAKFMEAVVTDQVLAEKFTALAGQQGYDFTVEELLEFGAVLPVSDEDMEQSVGGAYVKTSIDQFR